MRHFPAPLLALTVALSNALAGTANAQDHSQHAPTAKPVQEVDHTQMDHSKMDHSQSQMDHSKMDHSKMDHSKMDHSKMDHSKMDHSKTDAASPSRDEPVDPIPPVTDADRAAAFPELKLHMEHASELNHYLLFNRLEVADAEHGTGQAWEAQGWIGNDIDRLWLRSEGEREDSHTESADLEVLYGRSVSPWWDVVAGIRQDFKPGDSQTWAAFGVQGLAPYKFEMSATAYIGESGRTAANVEVEYELLLTNRLILQPLVELEFHGKDDPARGIGSGLSTGEAGLRLRYEFTRQFAPYIGIVHERAFGNTADLRRDEGEGTEDTRVVAGLRLWF